MRVSILQSVTQFCLLSYLVFRCLPQTSQSTCHGCDASSPLRAHDNVIPSATCNCCATCCYEFTMQPVGIQIKYKLSAFWIFVPTTKQICERRRRRCVQPTTGNYFEYLIQFWNFKKPFQQIKQKKLRFERYRCKASSVLTHTDQQWNPLY
jgi:hypothetical protein